MDDTELVESDVTVARRRQVFELVAQRKTFAQIGAELGISRHAAYQLWQRECSTYPLPDIDVFRRQQLAQIQVAKAALLDVLARDHVAIGVDGVVTRTTVDPFGTEHVEEVQDDDAIIKAASALVKLWERESKLIGGDAPIQVETKNAHVHFTVQGVDLSQLT